MKSCDKCLAPAKTNQPIAECVISLIYGGPEPVAVMDLCQPCFQDIRKRLTELVNDWELMRPKDGPSATPPGASPIKSGAESASEERNP